MSYGRALLPNKNSYRVKAKEEVLVREKWERVRKASDPRGSRSSTRLLVRDKERQPRKTPSPNS